MARGAVEFDSLDGWLGHKARGKGGKFLSGKWKEKQHLDTWMHMRRLPLVIWRHQFCMYVITEDRDTKEKTKHVYSKTFVCHEDEKVLQNPWRDRETGEREHPPQRCGLCKLNEWAWQECVAWVDSHTWDSETKEWKERKKGKGRGLDPCTILFKFVSEADDKENRTITLGGMCGYFNQKDLDDDVKAAAKKAKIRLDEVFKQSSTVKPESVMCVVNNDDIAAGVQISVETYALGEKVKEEIQRVWKSQEINIQKHPYVIRWEYHPDEQFSKKYSATAIMKIKPSERVLRLLKGDPPDLEQLKERFNQQSMRAVLEKHCLLDSVPWDDIFPSKEQEKKWSEEDEAEEEAEETDDEENDETEDSDEEEADDDEDEKEEKKTPPKKKTSKKDDEEEEDEDEEEEETESDDDDDEMVKCDKCKKPMKLSASKCPNCGKKYDVEDEEDEEDEEEEKPVAKTKTRSEAKAEKSSKKKSKKDDDDDDSQGDEVPF